MELELDKFGEYEFKSFKADFIKAIGHDMIIFLLFFFGFLGYCFGMMYLFKFLGLW